MFCFYILCDVWWVFQWRGWGGDGVAVAVVWGCESILFGGVNVYCFCFCFLLLFFWGESVNLYCLGA